MKKGRIILGQDFKGLEKLLKPYKSIYVVHDLNVLDFTEEVRAACGHRLKGTLGIKADENLKTMDTVMEIADWLLSQGADRDALVLTVGGGFTSDVAGFAACIYKRGVAYANIPTTLLAQVDAAIGGKTGVNRKALKNMIGVIVQPAFTYICPKALETLPAREFNSGAAEMLKTFLISDALLYERAVKALSAKYTEDLPSLILAAAKIKSIIVKADPFEHGGRRRLNFGHTYGHAIEWYQHTNQTADPYNHGEAVAIGMIEAARKSESRRIAKSGLSDKLAADFIACGLPVTLPCPEDKLEEAIRQDKKAEGRKLNFVFIKRPGKVKIKKI